MTQPSFLMFCFFVVITLIITYRASHSAKSRGGFYAAGGGISGVQNGFAFAGDYMSASTFLGIAGLYFTTGLDGFIYSVGSVVGWPLLLFLFAERLRTLGRFTLTDVLASRFADRPVRLFSAAATLVVLTFYMISQLVGAGALVELLLGIDFTWSVLTVGGLMIVYVTFGGMVATTWIQIIKAGILLIGGTGLGVLTLAHFDFSLPKMLAQAVDRHPAGDALLAPSTLISGPVAALSLGLTLVCGPAGLPHIMMRFFTVPDAREARRSVAWATGLIGFFMCVVFVIGYGAVAVLAGDADYVDAKGILKGGSNMASLYLAKSLGGEVFLGFIAAVAFAPNLAVVAGLTLAAAATVSHDIYANVIKSGASDEATEIRVSRIGALIFGAICIALSIAFKSQNITFLVVTAFSVAASATFPVLLLTLFWRGLTMAGAMAGGTTGLVTAIAGIIAGPNVWVAAFGFATPLIPYQYPTVFAMPLAFLAAWLVSRIGASGHGRAA